MFATVNLLMNKDVLSLVFFLKVHQTKHKMMIIV